MWWKKIGARMMCIAVILVVFVATIWDFSLQLQGELTRETYQTLSEVSEDYNRAFLDRVSYNIKAMKVLAGGLKEMSGRTKQDIMRVLQNAVDDGGFEKMVVCDVNGISCSNNGISGDISHREYFQKAMQGKTNISEPITSIIDGEKSIVMAVPIHDEKSTTGVLFGVYPLLVGGMQLTDFSYYSEGYGFIVASDGTVLLSGEHTDKLANEENLFSFFEKTEISGFSVAEIKTAMENKESKSFKFKYDGERRFVSFTPSTVNDWYTFSIASDVMLQQQKSVTNKMVTRLILRVALIGAILLLWIFMRNRRHNKEILLANHKYQSLLSHINGGMIVAVHSQTAEGTIATYVSSGFTDMTGYTLEDIQNIYNGRYLDVIIEDDREAVFKMYLEQLKVGNTYHMPYRIRKKDGSLLWVMDNGYFVDNDEGLFNHSIITDITVIKKQEEELRMSENRFSVAINASSGTLFEVDLKKKLYTHFENAERIFGVNAEKLLSDTRAFSSLKFDEFVDAVTNYFFHPEDCIIAKNIMSELRKSKKASYEARLRRADNSYIWSKIDLTLSLDEFGVPSRLVGFMSDIDDIKKQAERLESKVQTDSMTGLYNKIAMFTISKKALNEYPTGRHALIVLDIDNFKGINDTLGHAFGDLVLVEVATKLKNAFRNHDVVGRMGGDEFAVLVKNVSDTSSVLKKAAELSATFRQTYSGEKEAYTISCSMGIIMIESNSEPFEVLYRKADAALYQAKRNGKDQFTLYQEKDADNYPIEFGGTNDEELQNLKMSHNIEAQIFELLYTSKDFNISINMALAAIGQQYHVSRVSIFENDSENLTTDNTYEWCNDGITPEIENLHHLKVVYGTDSILQSFDKNGLLYCNDVRELPSYQRRIFESGGVKSTLRVAVYNDEKICGFIGFDECKECRVWTSEEIEKLLFLAKVLSVFLFKKKTEIALLENLQTRLKILDVLPDYISVINPETHSLVYTNKKMQELLPEAITGAFCFTTLRGGQEKPCATCMVEKIKRGDTDNLEIVSEDKKLRLKVRAISINWTQNQKMVLIYGIEKEEKSF